MADPRALREVVWDAGRTVVGKEWDTASARRQPVRLGRPRAHLVEEPRGFGFIAPRSTAADSVMAGGMVRTAQPLDWDTLVRQGVRVGR